MDTDTDRHRHTHSHTDRIEVFAYTCIYNNIGYTYIAVDAYIC